MRTNVLNDLSNVVKKGTSRVQVGYKVEEETLAGSWSQRGQISDEGAIEHPLSTHSAPFGTKWKPAGEKGSTRVWKHVAMIFAVLVMSIANIGTAWGAYDVPANGKVTLSTKVNNSGRFNVEASGVYHFRLSDGYSWSDGNGIKTQSNQCGVIFYLDASTEIEVGIKHTESKNAHEVTVHVYSIPESEYKQFDDNKAGAAESNRTFSTGPSTSSDGSFTISVAATSSTFTGTKTLGAGYYAVVPVGGKSNTYFNSIKFTSGGGDTTPPTLSSSTPANAATDVAVSGNITLTFSENVTINDASKFTLSGGAGTLNTASATASGTVVTIPYSGLANNTTYTLATAAEAVKDGSNNKNAALSNISFTTVAAANPLGSHTLTWNLTVRESGSGESTLGTATTDIGTASTASTSTYLTSLTDLTGVGVKRTTDGKSNNTGKIETPSSYDADKYVTMTFAVASGYQFTPSSVSIKTVAVSTTKDLKFEFSDANGSYSVTKTSLSTSGTAATNTLDFSGCDKAFTGTVTVKIYVYGATNQYRLSTPLTIDGTVAAAVAPSCTAPNHVDVTGRWDRFAGETISLTATAYSSEGTGSPIAAGSITGYQWEKLVGTTWTALSNGTTDGVTTSGATTANLQIANCKATNSGKYRCVVSTGATCSTASATATDGTQGLGVKVFMLECYNDGTKTCSFTRTGDTQTGTATLTLAANTAYTFKFHVDNVYYGNNASINEDITNYVFCNSDNGGNCASNFTINSGLGGTFTLGIDYSTGGNSNVEGEPELSVTYPRKTIYLTPGVWNTAGAKFAFYYFRDGGSSGWTDLLTNNDCGMSAEIPQWNGVKINAVRLSDDATVGTWDKKWNQTSDITVNSNNSVVITDWGSGDSPYTYGTYAVPTYTISYAKGTPAASIDGSKADETKTCGVAFTLPNSAVFTRTGYTQVGWTTTDGGAQTHALGGTYTTNAAQTFYPVWEVAASLIALECNTLYKVEDMVASSITSITSTEQYAAGLSSNTKFEVLGTGTVNATGGPMAAKNDGATISGTSFTNSLYFKGAGNKSGEIPTSRGIKFIVPNAGKLDIYVKGPGSINIVKEGGSGTAIGSGDSNAKVTVDVTAGTYYLYATASSRTLFGIQLNCCTTPAAPTAFAAGSITSTGATFSITDAGDAASYDIYYSESSTAPTAGTAATTTSTEKTKAVTGLTASTTYYAWVRSVCDADHKSAWVALSGSSFTTSAAAATPILSWALSTNVSTWTATPTNNDETNLTDVATSTEHADIQSGATSGKTCKISLSSSATPDKYVTFTFKVACGKKLTPSSVWMEVANVGGSSGGKMTHKAELSDTYGHTISATVVPASDGVLNELNITNGGGTYFQGEVTLKVWAWNSSGTNGTAFRMGPNVKIFGAVGNQATPAATITWNTQPANGRVGDPDFAYDVTCSDGSTVTVTSANTTYATIVGGKLHYAAAGTTHLVATATDACGNTVTPVNSNDFTVSAAAPTYSVTHNLSNVTATSGATGAGAATEGVAYDAVFSANTGYVLPSTITVTIGGSPATVGTGYTWNASTGAFQVPAAQVTGAIVITIAGETAPATKDIYYGAITITAGALTRGSTGTVQFFTNTGGTIANNTEISLSTTLGAGSEYYLSNDLTGTELSKSSNWTTSSSSNRYVQGVKFGSGKSYTLALGSKVASSITFYGINGSASKTMTVGGEEFTSSSTKNTFAKHEFIKTGGFTGNVSITQDGDFYGILVITIQTATPCTTPVIPTLSNQTVCPGSDIAAWDATQTAVLADGETVTYSWKKKGNDTELANTATFDLGSSAAESQAGTYVVTVTVSKAGKASATATKEVTLTVTAAVEEPVITANKATVYPGNSVTLTATCGTDGVTWNWYLCANADGTGAGSSLGTSSSYTIASAGAAGTYYYKAVATGSCGTAERVYTLVVTAASECEKYFWFVYAADATSNGVVNNRDGFFTGAPTGSSNSSTYKFTLDGTEYTATKNTGSGSFSISFTIPEGSTASMGINCKGSSSKPLYLTHSSGTPQKLVSNSSSNASCTVEDITEGTWTLTSAGSWTLAALGVQVCTTSTCTDATPTIAAANTTVCVGSELSISATGYETGATFQWQKLNGSAWDNISGAESATYTVATAAAEHAGSYRLVATKGCARTSNTVTIAVPTLPNFGSTVPASVSVMQTIALSINTVEATDAVKYRWYKSADATWDAGDTEIGTNKELIKAYDGEAIGTPSYYIFCRAQNSCGITTSTAIAVNVTDYVEEDCATRGNEGDAEFGFENTSAGQGSYQSTNCWTMNSNSKYLTYTAPEGKYFKTAKVTIASSSENKASYNWSTNGGTSYTAVSLTVNSTLTERTINLSAHGNVNAFQIGRNFDSKGSSGGTLYVSKICFEYTEACTATTVTPSATSKIYEMGGAWSNPTFTVKYGGTAFDPQPTLSYSSSNEDIASVDDDGTVTFNGEAGTVTITASYAGGTISETEYCASSGSYTINVSCPGGAPKVVADGSTDMSGCNTSVTLHAKKQDGTAFDDGTYQWFRNGEEIDGATSSSYTATQAGTYTVERTNTSGCTTPSTTSAVVTSETTEPEVERLVPFQYYHVNKTYSDQMKMRHLFAVKNSGTLDGKHFKMYVSRNGAAATDVTSSNALVVWPSNDGHVDTVMVDLNKLSGKYSENDELVYTCKAIDCSGNVSDVYKNTITMNVIGATPTLALICSGTSKAEGTRKTSELTVGGDFLTGYNVADLCQQTGNTSFDANTEWGLYTDLKANYIVTPVNGYAVFNKLNYEPFDILLLTDYPKASKSDAAKDVLDDMAALCDYRPMLSFKTHMVAKSPSKWAAKGFTTSATENKADGRLNLNIVCYAHPMFDAIKTGDDVYNDTENTSAPLIYTMLSGTGHEGNKGMQGFEIAAAENFVTIGLTHYNATIAKVGTNATWTPGSEDRMLVTVAERQTNIEARMILFSLNCGAQSKLTDKGEQVVLACLNYLLETDPLKVADCSFTFDNGASNEHNAAWYAEHCPGCTGTKGDGLWSTAANWAPDYRLLPGEFTSVRIAAPVTVDLEHAHVLDARIKEGGQIIIPAGKGLDMKGTIRRLDGSEISPTENSDLFLGSTSAGNGSLIFNNDKGDTKATVAMYTTALADIENMSATTSTWQYIGTPHNDVARATYNYYDSWLYQYSGSGWEVIPNGGPLVPFRGYCVTHPQANHTFVMYGTLTATTNVDIDVPAGYTVIANSWVAPIDITTLTDDDMEGIDDKTIYFFNTGSDAEGENGTGTAPGTYVAVPKNAASYVGNWQIPSMQGFYLSSSSAGTLHLDYGRHIRPAGERTTIVNNPMYAPRRAKAADEEPLVLKMFARGSRYHDKLVVLEREDFTTGYDSGWDGEAWGGSDLSPQIYVIGGGRYDAVSAIPDFEGTVVAFRAGEDEEYTIDFIYDAENEPLYLFDTENNSYTQIVTGGAYHFTTSDKAAHSRFILTRHAPQIATGCENLDGGEGAKAKKLLIEDKMFIMVNGLLYDATGKVVK